MVVSGRAKLLLTLWLKLAVRSSGAGGQGLLQGHALIEALAPELQAPVEVGVSDPLWLGLTQRHSARVLAPRLRTGFEAIVGARGAEDARTLRAFAVGANTALVRSTGDADRWTGRSGWRPLDSNLSGNLTVVRGSGDGTAVVHRTDHAHKTQVLIPISALILGTVLGLARCPSAGLTLGYFGAQSGLSLYMKLVLCDAVISEELGLKGMPAAFLITAVQQVVAFLSMSTFFAVSWVANWRAEPKRPKSSRQLAMVLCLSLSFAANIGLNNFSLSLMAISLNLVIRTCLPLVTLAMHALIGVLQPGAFPKVRSSEAAVVLAGVACAGLVTLSEFKTSMDVAEFRQQMLGVLMCFVSICAGSLDLILGKLLGKQMGLNAMETTWYMSLPAASALLPPALFVHHPVEWRGFPQTTDWAVLMKVLDLKPFTLVLVLLSGVFSVSYNVLRYAMVQQLSASHTAFAGNFNKALTILISLVLGLERLPDGMWCSVMLLSIVGSISAFMAYSLMTTANAVRSPTKVLKEVAQTEA